MGTDADMLTGSERSGMDVKQGAEHCVRRANNIGAGLGQQKGLA